MPIKYQNRRGTSTEANTITLSEGELYMDLTNKKLRIHDGILAGGYELARTSELTSGLSAKQATLVSGTNIKTINGSSVLGSGDLTVSQLTLASEVNTPASIKNLKTNTSLTLQYGTLTTSQYKFSDEGGSILVSSIASGINEFALTSSLPATYEFWYYPSTAGTNEYIFSVLGQDNNNFSLDRTGGFYVSDNTNGSSGLSSNRTNGQITWGNWHHVAIYLTSTEFTIWFDGTKTETYSLGASYQLTKARTAIRLGGHYNGWTKPDGYYGQVLVTSGDKYGSTNNSITVPTSSFVTTTNTPFLLKYIAADQRLSINGKLTANSVLANSFTGSSIDLGNGNITAGAITATSVSGDGGGLTNLTGTKVLYRGLLTYTDSLNLDISGYRRIDVDIILSGDGTTMWSNVIGLNDANNTASNVLLNTVYHRIASGTGLAGSWNDITSYGGFTANVLYSGANIQYARGHQKWTINIPKTNPNTNWNAIGETWTDVSSIAHNFVQCYPINNPTFVPTRLTTVAGSWPNNATAKMYIIVTGQ